MLNYTHLASQKDIESFSPNDLAEYRYIVLIGLNQSANELSPVEFGYIQGSLASFMKEDCYVVMEQQLKNASEDCFIRLIYTDIEPRHSDDGYIAISTIFNNVNQKVHLNPVYQTIRITDKDARYPYYDAINDALDNIQEALYYESLSDFPVPEPKTKSAHSITPFGAKIRSLRKQIGSQEAVSEMTVNGDSISLETLKSIEQFNATDPGCINIISQILGVTSESISLDQVIPNRAQLIEMRRQTTLSKAELARDFGLHSGFFFDLLEDAPVIPSSTLRFVHSRYKDILNKKKLSAAKLIDTEATESRCH